MPTRRPTPKQRVNKYLTDRKLGETTNDFIRCRTLRHAWDAIGSGDRRPIFGELVCLRCVFCGTLRYDKFSRLTGERISAPSYVWPDGYRDAESHDAAWWRRQWADTVSDYLVEPEPVPKKRAARG
jgi:hypothetical protein